MIPIRSSSALLVLPLLTVMLLTFHSIVMAVPFTDIVAGLPGVGSCSASWGDFDNDGDLDLAIAGNGASGNIARIYRNDAGIFNDIVAMLPDITTGTVAWGDYDNDDDLDLFLMGDTGTGWVANIYRNDAGVFTDIAAGLPGTGAGSAAWGDYDNDGDLDLLMAGSSTPSTISRIYRNDGGGLFTDILAGLPGVNRCSVAWGDYDNDGDLDILMTGNSQTGYLAKVYRNDTGTFTDAGAGLVQVGWSMGAWGDYDADGDLDIALAGDSGSWPSPGDISRVYRNDGSGVFTNVSASIVGLEQGMVAWGDCDNDGDLDLAVAGSAASVPTTRVYRNDGGGVFTDFSAGLPGAYAASLAWGDFDNDGKLDVLLAGLSTSGRIARIYRNDGPSANTPPSAPSALAAAAVGLGLNLDWSSSADAQTPTAGLSYNLRVGTTPDGGDVVSAMADLATGYRRLAQLGNAQASTSWAVAVPHAGIYYWSVQAVDGAYSGSPFPPEQSVAVVAFTDIASGLAGVDSSDVAWGDYDDDGDLDLVLTGDAASGHIARIYRNDGAGVLTDISAGLPGVWGGSAEWGDCDNDGDLDLALTGYTSSGYIARVYRNDGAGVFVDIAAGLPGVWGGRATWGDHDNDGDLDILLTGLSSSGLITCVYRNDGGGAFVDLTAGLPGVSGAGCWGDYDTDGDLDLLLWGYTGTGSIARIYRNDGGGVFVDIAAGLPGVMWGAGAWGDYDSDGDLDLVLTGFDGSGPLARVYRNDGGGVFVDIAAGLPGVTNGAGVWGDYDNDGDLDLILMGDDGTGSICRVYRNDGGSAFADAAVGLPGFLFGAAAWGDFDGDGDLDLALAGKTDSGNRAGIWRSDGAPSNSPPTAPSGLSATVAGTQVTLSWNPAVDAETPTAGLSYNVRLGTTSGGNEVISAMADPANGYRRVIRLGNAQKQTSWTVTLPYGGSFYWSVQAVDGAFAGSPFAGQQSFGAIGFTDITAGLTGVQSGSVEWGDYDNDGDLDLAVTGYTGSVDSAAVYRNDGSGVFTDISAALKSVRWGSVAWGDYDNDQDLDLAVTGFASWGRSTVVYRNEGGAFIDVGAGLVGTQDGSIAWGDYDNDGDLDLVLAGYTSSGRDFRVYRNDGGSVFTDAAVGLPGLEAGSVAWGDYDNDGDLDLVLIGKTSPVDAVAGIYRNDANGVFTDIAAGLTSAHHGSVEWGDYDNDGDLDLAMTGSGGPGSLARIYRNDGGGVFTDLAAGLVGVSEGSTAWGDYDNDGDLDLMVTGDAGGSNYITRLYRNDGGGTFTGLTVGPPGVRMSGVALGDYDNDGDLDLALVGDAGGSTNVARIYRSDGASPNSFPAAPAGLSASVSGDWVRFDWSASTDAQTASAGLSYNLRVGVTPGGDEISSATATAGGYRRLPQLGNANGNLSWRLHWSALQSAAMTHWSAQAIDGAWSGSPFAPEQAFTLAPIIQSVSDVPGDEGGQIRLNVTAAPFDNVTETLHPMFTYNVWQRIDDPALLASVAQHGVSRGPGAPKLAAPDMKEVPQDLVLPPGFISIEWGDRYFVESRVVAHASCAPSFRAITDESTSAPAFPPGLWELVGSFAAAQLTQYAYRATTVVDSPTVSVYLVSAHATPPSAWFLSDPDSGWSTDNIAPGVPEGLTATYTPGTGVMLEWLASEAEDFQYFRVYRDRSPGFVIAPANLLHSTVELSWTDSEPLDGPIYYKLTAVDHAGNESPPASLTEIVGVPKEHAPPVAYALHSSVPNPFELTSSIGFDMVRPGEVRIAIFDVQGRLVRRLVSGTRPAGRHRVEWDGRDSRGRAVAAGAYLCRMEVASFRSTRRVVLIP